MTNETNSTPSAPENAAFDRAFAWLRAEASETELENLTQEGTQERYRAEFWDALPCETLPAPLALAVFDCGVHQGVGIARRLLCKTLGINPNDPMPVITPDTFANLDAPYILEGFLALRLRRYAFSSGNVVNMEAWAGRILRLHAELILLLPEEGPREIQTGHESEADDLTTIKGIGPASVAKLSALGITSLAQLAGANDDQKTTLQEQFPSKTPEDFDAWIAQAKDLVEGGQ